MLLRVAVAVHDKTLAQALTNRMVSFSLRCQDEDDVDFDFSYYNDLSRLLHSALEIDMAVISYEILQEKKHLLPLLYAKNAKIFSVPMGQPDGKICDFLALRPAGYLGNPNDQNQIDRLCTWCAEGMALNNEVLQLKTRQGCYAVSTMSILYCQSDQKYVMVVTQSGKIYRKLDKLDQLAISLPEYFVRVHQSFLVNSRRISGLDKSSWEILLDSGDRIPVSRAYQKSIADQIQKFLFNIQI